MSTPERNPYLLISPLGRDGCTARHAEVEFLPNGDIRVDGHIYHEQKPPETKEEPKR